MSVTVIVRSTGLSTGADIFLNLSGSSFGRTAPAVSTIAFFINASPPAPGPSNASPLNLCFVLFRVNSWIALCFNAKSIHEITRNLCNLRIMLLDRSEGAAGKFLLQIRVALFAGHQITEHAFYSAVAPRKLNHSFGEWRSPEVSVKPAAHLRSTT